MRAPGRGAAEVVLYSPEHDATLASLGEVQVRKVVDLWAERTEALLARPEIAYVLVFENRGAEAGATIPHPHGQIFGFPFVPQAPAKEAAVAAEHGCPVCAALAFERGAGERVFYNARGWCAYVPFASGWPYGALLAPHEHVPRLPELGGPARGDLAAALVDVLGRYDRLFGPRFPYMMWIHPGVHLHVHVATPLRDRATVRYAAGVLRVLAKRGRPPAGLDGVVSSTIPVVPGSPRASRSRSRSPSR
jgi:UDPglucose--hexose-1-phosphate uridylyltransferase